MKSIKNHLSLILALLSILFSVQVFVIVDRAIDAYKTGLANNYSIVMVSQKSLDEATIKGLNPLIKSYSELSPDAVIKRLSSDLNSKNAELLKLTLPKFYKIYLTTYPSPSEIKKLTADLLKNQFVTKVEDFAHTHDVTYKLLMLFKNVISLFAIVVFVVTVLLIFKELRIWQYKHSERMNVMGLFGAPVWLRSAVLFRLAIVDAIISSLIAFGAFTYAATHQVVIQKLQSIGIEVKVFDLIQDAPILFGIAMTLSLILAFLIVMGHKEEV